MSSPQTPGSGSPRGMKRKADSSPLDNQDNTHRPRLDHHSGIMSVEEYWRQRDMENVPAGQTQSSPHTQGPVDRSTPGHHQPSASSFAAGGDFDQMLQELEAEENNQQNKKDQSQLRKDSGYQPYTPQQDQATSAAPSQPASSPLTTMAAQGRQSSPHPLDTPTAEELEADLDDDETPSVRSITMATHGSATPSHSSPGPNTSRRGQSSLRKTPSSPASFDPRDAKEEPEYHASAASKAAHKEGPQPKHKRTFDINIRRYAPDDAEDRLELFWALYNSVDCLLKGDRSVANCRLQLHKSYQANIDDLATVFGVHSADVPAQVGQKGWFNYFEDWDCAWSGQKHDTEIVKQAWLTVPKAQRAAIKEASRPILVNISEDRRSSETSTVESKGIVFGQWVDVALDEGGKMVIVGMEPES